MESVPIGSKSNKNYSGKAKEQKKVLYDKNPYDDNGWWDGLWFT
jgi:hypothetical protein